MFENQFSEWHLITAALLLRYAVNLLSMFILIRLIYFRTYRKSGLVPSFFVFNTIIFFVTYMLNMVEMSTGAAFGLFAVFSMLRYRTDGISTKDMTYLFLSIAIGLLTSVSKGSLSEIVFINTLLIVLAFVLENNLIVQREISKVIQYDNIDNISPDRHQHIIDDLKIKTGLDIKRIVISDIDFIKDSCSVTIYYVENRKK